MTGPLRRTLTEASWDALYDFLDPNRPGKTSPHRNEEAEAKCLEVTRKLAVFFASRGCGEADDLAAETILRVAAKAAEVSRSTGEDPLGYFFGVARNVHLEWLREARRETVKRESALRDPTVHPIHQTNSWRNEEVVHRCLDRCMATLTGTARRLLVSYYSYEKAAKIERHRRLAEEFGKSMNALRIEVHRMRKVLRQCVSGCVQPALAGVSR